MPRALKIMEKMPIEKIPIKMMMPKNVPCARSSDEVRSMLPTINAPINIITGIARNTRIFLLSGFRSFFQSIHFIRLACLYRYCHGGMWGIINKIGKAIDVLLKKKTRTIKGSCLRSSLRSSLRGELYVFERLAFWLMPELFQAIRLCVHFSWSCN